MSGQSGNPKATMSHLLKRHRKFLSASMLGLWIFAEWQQVHVLKLLLGATLIVIGGIIVSDA